MLRYFMLIFLVCLWPGISAADDLSLDSVVSALQTPFQSTTAAEQRIQDLHADFNQISHIASIDRSQRGAGEVYFRFIAGAAQLDQLSRFRWEYSAPTEQEIISDGTTLWVYQPDNRQAIRSDISQLAKGGNPVMFLASLGQLSRDFTIGWGKTPVDEQGNYLLELTPKQPSQLISLIEVLVSHEAVDNWRNKAAGKIIFPLKMTRVTDAGGNLTTIEFSHVRVNQQLNEKLFSFELPEGVDLLESAEQLNF